MQIYQYLQTNWRLKLVLGGSKQGLHGYVDAAHVDHPDRKLTSSFIFYYGKGLTSWSLKKQSIITPSSTIAEYLVYDPATKECL